MAPPTFRDFVAGPWREACHDRCKPSTRRRTERAIETQLLPSFGNLPLDRIQPSAVHVWFDRYSQTAPGGANRTLDVLRQMMNHAAACGHITANPTRGVRRNPRRKPTRFLSRSEVDRLHAAVDRHRGRGSGRQQAEIIRLLLFTGCRRAEIVRLRWSEVDGDALRLSDGKTGPRAVVLNAPARAVLARQPRTGSPYVFPSPADSSRSRSDDLSLWRKVRREAGIPDVRLHDLRHTFASHAVMQSVPLPVVSRLLGHARAGMTLRYAHVSDRETEAAAERIGGTIAALLAGSASVSQTAGTSRKPIRPSPVQGGTADPDPEPAVAVSTSNGAGGTRSRNMEAVSARELRQSLGGVLDQLERGAGPVIVRRRRRPAAVLVSLEDYRERFVAREAAGRPHAAARPNGLGLQPRGPAAARAPAAGPRSA